MPCPLAKPVLGHLRAGGLRILAYLDDFHIIGSSKEEAEEGFKYTRCLLEELGFSESQEVSTSGSNMGRVSEICDQLHPDEV